MSTVIDKQSQQSKLGAWPVTESVTVTLTLLETNPGEFGVNYEAEYSGIQNGRVAGGPIPISGNGSWVVNQDPKVTVNVSNYSDDKNARVISGHVKITLAMLGNHTIFDKTMGGKYGINPLAMILEHFTGINKLAMAFRATIPNP